MTEYIIIPIGPVNLTSVMAVAVGISQCTQRSIDRDVCVCSARLSIYFDRVIPYEIDQNLWRPSHVFDRHKAFSIFERLNLLKVRLTM
jgi:hypothetical protein